MLGAIYIGLSGMNAFSRGLQTISNNVANLNSPGYKASSVSFADVFNVGGLGSAYSGHNGRSFGAGVRFGAPGVDFAQGDMRQTGGDLDLAVQGNGFMVLTEGDNKTYYARTGQFAVDEEGFIALQGTRYRLNGVNAAGEVSPFNIDSRRVALPEATTSVRFGGNVPSDVTSATISDITVYDSRGKTHAWKVIFTRTDVADEWKIEVKAGDTLVAGGAPEIKVRFGTTSPFRIIDPTDGKITLDNVLEGGDVTLDLSALRSTSGAADFTKTPNGRGVASLAQVSVNESGHVILTYSDARTEDLGSIALADFRNPQQLERIGDGMFAYSGDDARLMASGTDGMGKLVSKQLEASNVDLSQQFGDLILIQRGFQASSQVVSVSNDMIQQLFGIRGQG